MAREDLIQSAISFLQDPSVASSSPATRIAFLRSKNLTQEEIDIALARSGTSTESAASLPPPPPPSSAPPQQYQGYPHGYGYPNGSYPGGPGAWMGASPPLPQEPPRRDWRDWFIMATVTGGIGYGLYAAAQRYILPLLRPPTTPQLEADQANINDSFARAFALIDQLATDTAALRTAEESRTEKLDTAIRDVEAAVADLKAAGSRREAEARVLVDQVNGVRDLVPRCLEGWREAQEKRLEEVVADVGGLRRLMENRVGLSSSSSSSTSAVNGTSGGSTGGGRTGSPAPTNGLPPSSSSPAPPSTASGSGVGTGASSGSTVQSPSSFSTGKKAGGRAAIPAWQMAASNSNATTNPGSGSHSPSASVSGAGTATTANGDGAEA